MGDVIDFQERKQRAQERLKAKGGSKWGGKKGGGEVVPLGNLIRLNYLTDDLGTQLNLDSLKSMIMNKDTFTVHLWYSEEAKDGNIYEIPYDVALQYGSYEEAFKSFKAIENAVRTSRGLDDL